MIVQALSMDFARAETVSDVSSVADEFDRRNTTQTDVISFRSQPASRPDGVDHILAAGGKPAEPRFEPPTNASAPGEEKNIAGADVGEARIDEPTPGFGLPQQNGVAVELAGADDEAGQRIPRVVLAEQDEAAAPGDTRRLGQERGTLVDGYVVKDADGDHDVETLVGEWRAETVGGDQPSARSCGLLETG